MTPPPGPIIWFIGLSGAGKTTLAQALQTELQSRPQAVKLLDGDELRKGLCANLGFSLPDRMENIRRTACAAALLSESGVTVIVATISPLQRFRDQAREILPNLTEVFVDTPLEVCETRDPKGLYRQARAGTLKNFTGIDSPFEPPTTSQVHCHPAHQTITESTQKVLDYLATRPPPA